MVASIGVFPFSLTKVIISFASLYFPQTASTLLKPFLARSKIKCIGATTIDEYHKTISKDKALARRFKNIYIEEPSNKEVFKILKELKKDYEKYFNVLYSDNIIKYIINSSKYLHNLNNPDKSIDILDESGAITKQRNKSKVSYNIIKEVVFNSLGLNRKLIITKLIKSSLDNNIKIKIEKYLNLNTKKYIFNINNENILEIDLADYNNDIHSSTLLGSSPGYVGYEDSGLLSKQILRHSINLIIFKNYIFMSTINIYLIQEKIKLMPYITVPWLQAEYNMDYINAKELMDFLVRRGWVEEQPVGIKYFVIKNNLCLRRLVREEVAGLVEDITSDFSAALFCIKNSNGEGATFSEIEIAVQGEDDAEKAIMLLEKHRLIQLVNNRYFSTVSRETIVITDVSQEKNPGPFRRMFTDKTDDCSQLEKKFNVLFDD